MKVLVGVVVLASLLAAVPASAAPPGPGGFLPPSGAVSGWEMRSQPRAFGPTDLYQYIDGAADLFRAYGFVSLATAEYLGPRQSAVTVDIYDMGAPLHAFGVFASERPEGAKALDFGTQSYADARLVAFWQGQYYVKVSQVAGESEEAAAALAKATSARLPPSPTMPPELGRLPAQRRVPGSERYYRESALGHKFLLDTVGATYRQGRTTADLYVADLGTPEKAAEGLKNLREFERGTGEDVKDIARLGESAFGAHDPSLGELVAVKKGRYLVVGTSLSASRSVITRFVEPALTRLGLETKPAPASGST